MINKYILLLLFVILLFGCNTRVKRNQAYAKPSGVSLDCLTKLDSLKVDGFERYPYWLPNWLWRDQLRSAFIDSADRKDLEYKICKWLALSEDSTAKYAADSLADVIAQELSWKFTGPDITRDGKILKNDENNAMWAVHLDPVFDSISKEVIYKAINIYLHVALEETVLKEAFDSSIENATPIPVMYDSSILGDGPTKSYSSGYKLYLKTKQKPRSISGFKREIHEVLGSKNESPALLIISAFKGYWWGWTWYNYYYSPEHQLSRLSPGSGYEYIAFNYDSLKVNRDPAFWASKVAHEMLHALGYYHPKYASWQDRDNNNQGANKAFIVAYEFAILRKSREYVRLHGDAIK